MVWPTESIYSTFKRLLVVVYKIFFISRSKYKLCEKSPVPPCFLFLLASQIYVILEFYLLNPIFRAYFEINSLAAFFSFFDFLALPRIRWIVSILKIQIIFSLNPNWHETLYKFEYKSKYLVNMAGLCIIILLHLNRYPDRFIYRWIYIKKLFRYLYSGTAKENIHLNEK